MVIIDLLCPCHTVKVKGQQVSVVNLQDKEGELGSWKEFKLQRSPFSSPNTSLDHTGEYPSVHCLWIRGSFQSKDLSYIASVDFSEDRGRKPG